MFRQLFERLPDIVSSGEPDRLRSSFINGIKHLDCTFTPVRCGRRLTGRAGRRLAHGRTAGVSANSLIGGEGPRSPHGARSPVHRDGDADHFGHLASRGPTMGRTTRVGGDAPVALPGDGDGQRDELLHARGQRTFRHGRLVQRAVPGHDVGYGLGQFAVRAPGDPR